MLNNIFIQLQISLGLIIGIHNLHRNSMLLISVFFFLIKKIEQKIVKNLENLCVSIQI